VFFLIYLLIQLLNYYSNFYIFVILQDLVSQYLNTTLSTKFIMQRYLKFSKQKLLLVLCSLWFSMLIEEEQLNNNFNFSIHPIQKSSLHYCEKKDNNNNYYSNFYIFVILQDLVSQYLNTTLSTRFIMQRYLKFSQQKLLVLCSLWFSMLIEEDKLNSNFNFSIHPIQKSSLHYCEKKKITIIIIIQIWTFYMNNLHKSTVLDN